MPLTNSYTDAYLAPIVTQEREDRATADIADLGTFPDAWTARLIVIRTYLLTCLESQKSADDVFASKLASYRKEFESTLAQAKAAQRATEDADDGVGTGSGSPFTVSLERS